MSNKEIALFYASLGWPVAPISIGTKHPRIPRWQTEASTDPAQITAWWDETPTDGISILTGSRSGIFAVDIDPRHGGDESWDDLIAQHGEAGSTTESLTGGGGRHLIYRIPAGAIITNASATNLPIGIDIRGEGGQIVAPPTIHPASGLPMRGKHPPIRQKGCSPRTNAVASSPPPSPDPIANPETRTPRICRHRFDRRALRSRPHMAFAPPRRRMVIPLRKSRTSNWRNIRTMDTLKERHPRWIVRFALLPRKRCPQSVHRSDRRPPARRNLHTVRILDSNTPRRRSLRSNPRLPAPHQQPNIAQTAPDSPSVKQARRWPRDKRRRRKPSSDHP